MNRAVHDCEVRKDIELLYELAPPQAAALRDILNVLRRRHHSATVLIYPAQVQGESAATEVSVKSRCSSE